MPESELYELGMATRMEVLGEEYVRASVEGADDFMMALQRLTTEWAWGYVWNRPGLDRRSRSLMNIAILTALGRSTELKLHVRGALINGVSAEEIKEALLQATVYCGVPAGLEAFRAAHDVLVREGALE